MKVDREEVEFAYIFISNSAIRGICRDSMQQSGQKDVE